MWAFSRFVRYFDESARHGSMRKASDTLHVSSSSVDRQILKVEDQIGVPLFERQTHGLRLTSAGELVLQSLRKWQNEMQALQSRIEDLKGLKRGKVVLAVIEGAASDFVATAALDFHRSFPSINFELLTYGAHRVTEAVMSGEVDFGLTVNPRMAPGLEVVAQKSFRMGAVVAAEHPLAGRVQLRLSDCLLYKLVIANSTLDLRLIVDEVLSRASAKPELIASSNSVMLMKELVTRGMGIGLMTEMDADKEVRSGQLVYIPLADRPIPPSVLTLCTSADRQLSLAATTLLDLVKTRLSQM